MRSFLACIQDLPGSSSLLPHCRRRVSTAESDLATPFRRAFGCLGECKIIGHCLIFRTCRQGWRRKGTPSFCRFRDNFRIDEPGSTQKHFRVGQVNLRNLRPRVSLRYVYFTGFAQMVLKRNLNNRRRRKRQLLNTSVQVFTGSACVGALGINLSDVGMCLFSMANLPLGSQIEVEFLPPRCHEPVRILATVRHRAVYLYGIEFLASSDRDRPSWAEIAPVPNS
jgi:PilZ domain-containing protein